MRVSSMLPSGHGDVLLLSKSDALNNWINVKTWVCRCRVWPCAMIVKGAGDSAVYKRDSDGDLR
ncbi:uncharacterized protein DFE_2334 [Desulfovibrio ferrophilus]|uniref:Uncharacterized protein n=1 Tax=Desulfovibrio ferrophilus TaxID=241368 RepID=A0A2Z6B0V2_9BACT|nr:uncharacterized protein DFE_2334 [Desulfovibrio ferrophilus]